MKSLKSVGNRISEPRVQLKILNDSHIGKFEEKLKGNQNFPLLSKEIEILQINLGKMCNQVCDHCHVDAGPDRKEIMSRETMELCLNAIKRSSIHTIDLTGGAPEMNPNFRWFVQELSQLKKKIIVRCNLTIILANKKYNSLPEFFKKHAIKVVSSLPCYTETNTDAQRGKGVFEKSIEALKRLNSIGYGKEEYGLELDLVYNPSGVSLPGNQNELERDYKFRLKEDFTISFNHLLTITNMPISRFLNYLINSENQDIYMSKLEDTFNPLSINDLMCRNTISVAWDGFLYDCDFNQMLDLKLKNISHIKDFDELTLKKREIIVNQHCYGCTAGAGSGCSGAILA